MARYHITSSTSGLAMQRLQDRLELSTASTWHWPKGRGKSGLKRASINTKQTFARNIYRKSRAIIHPPLLTLIRNGRISVRRRQLKSSHSEKRDHRVSLVDWEVAGWYPSYWEYASAFVAFRWNDDWNDHVERIVDAYIPDASLLKIVPKICGF
jgi:hypothetical protein